MIILYLKQINSYYNYKTYTIFKYLNIQILKKFYKVYYIS